MYAYPTTPQVWGNITKASCVEELIDLVDLAHDVGHEARAFWVREDGLDFQLTVARRANGMFCIRYRASNTFEIGGMELLANRLGEAMAEDRLFSFVLDEPDPKTEPDPIRQARAFIERRVPVHVPEAA